MFVNVFPAPSSHRTVTDSSFGINTFGFSVTRGRQNAVAAKADIKSIEIIIFFIAHLFYILSLR